jgi:hypothetical protein
MVGKISFCPPHSQRRVDVEDVYEQVLSHDFCANV